MRTSAHWLANTRLYAPASSAGRLCEIFPKRALSVRPIENLRYGACFRQRNGRREIFLHFFKKLEFPRARREFVLGEPGPIEQSRCVSSPAVAQNRDDG